MPVRVWVPGCATGEEVYTMVICLLDALADLGRARPPSLATDLCESAMEVARSGHYGALAEAIPAAACNGSAPG